MNLEKKTIAELLESALEGRLSLEQLYNKWPEEVDGIDYYEKIFDQIENAVEHFPGKLISGVSDYTKWHSSAEYIELKNTLEVLKSSIRLPPS